MTLFERKRRGAGEGDSGICVMPTTVAPFIQMARANTGKRLVSQYVLKVAQLQYIGPRSQGVWVERKRSNRMRYQHRAERVFLEDGFSEAALEKIVQIEREAEQDPECDPRELFALANWKSLNLTDMGRWADALPVLERLVQGEEKYQTSYGLAMVVLDYLSCTRKVRGKDVDVDSALKQVSALHIVKGEPCLALVVRELLRFSSGKDSAIVQELYADACKTVGIPARKVTARNVRELIKAYRQFTRQRSCSRPVDKTPADDTE